MNRQPKIAMLRTETCQRSLSIRLLYCRSPTNTELGSIRELVNDIQIVHPIEPQYATSAISSAGAKCQMRRQT